MTRFPCLLEQDKVWGVAYKIAQVDIPAVTSHLDYREKGGYKQATVTFHPRDESEESFQLTLYIGTEDNPFFLGPAPLKEMAIQIFHSEGPSGKNKDYVINLANALRAIAPEAEDSHLFSLEEELLHLQECENSRDHGSS